jgi:F-type H+-transporting ATPase subunit gamma
MQTLVEIQNRIDKLEDIRHLLRSLRAISAIRWRRSRAHLWTAKTYASSVDNQLGLILGLRKEHSQVKEEIKERQPQNEVIGLITLTSDRGLCGSFNTSIVNHAIELAKTWQKNNNTVKMILFGGYGGQIFQQSGLDVLYQADFPFTHDVSFVSGRNIADQIKDFHESNVISQLFVIYNEFISFGKYESKLVRLLPFDLSEIARPDEEEYKDLIIASDPVELEEFQIWEHFSTRLYLALLGSMVSENSARLQAMDSAISNLDDRMAQLEQNYHAIRQESITQEILEVQSNISRELFPSGS